MKKYIFENGVMKLNPAYKSEPSTVANPRQSLAVVSSPSDIAEADKAQKEAIGESMQLAPATESSIEIMQDPEYLEKFGTPETQDGGELLDGLTREFSKYEVPIGLVNKLLALSEYELNFIIDDSGSMGMQSDAETSEASAFMKQKMSPHSGTMSRWQESENRLHIMIDMLAYIPIDRMTFSFLNRREKLELSHREKNPQEFADDAHRKISDLFRSGPSGGTPVYRALENAFKNTHTNTMHYLLTDGVPSDATTEEVKTLVNNRKNPQMCPLMFISCTNEDKEAEWMKEIEEVAPFCSEVDDFHDEQREVLKDQGPAFPFTRGFWLICQLAAAINPYDLDKMDESIPFTRCTMNNLLGRKLTVDDYQHYFTSNPNSRKYVSFQREFEREDIMSHQIHGLSQKSSGIMGMFGKKKEPQDEQKEYASGYRP